MKLTDRQAKRALAALGLVYGIVVLVTHRDYGINFDEPLHVDYGRSVVRWYLSGSTDRAIFSYTNIWLYGGLYDTVAYLLTRLVPYDVFHTRHLLNAATGFGGVIGVFFLARHLGSPRAGLIAAVLLLLVPRYYGHAMFNHKDIPFAVGYVWSLYLILRSADTFSSVSRKIAVLTGIAVGATIGIRVAGAILVAYYAAVTLPTLMARSPRANWKPALRSALLTGGTAYLVMIVCWPWVHAEPLTRPFRALTMISDFPFSISTWFEGRIYDSAEVPWYYAVKWLAIGLPEFLLIGTAASIVIGIRSIFRSGDGTSARSTRFILVAALFPIAYVIASDASLYNGMRHVLFVVPPLCALSAVFFDRLLERRDHLSRAVIVVVAASLLLTLVDVVRQHPNQYVYFNRVFAGGLSSASMAFDTDYYGNSYRIGAQWVDRNAPGSSVHMPVAEIVSSTSLRHNPIPWQADFVLEGIPPDRHRAIPGDVAHTVETAGVPILRVVKRDPQWQGEPVYDGPGSEFHEAGLAELHGRLNRVDQAEALYRRALTKRPDRAIWHYKLGRLLLDHDRLEDAAAAYERAIAITPTYRAHFHLASCYHRLEQYERAVENYERALGIRFDSEWACLNLGGSLSALGRREEAERAYLQTLAVNPTVTEARERLGELYARQKRYDEAVDVLEAIEDESRTPDVYRLISISQRELGNVSAAEKAAERLVERSPEDRAAWEEYLNVGTAHHAMDNLERAESIYTSYLERHQESVRGWQNLALLLFAQDRFSEALSAFERAHGADSTAVEPLLGAAQSAARIERWNDARQHYRRVLDLDPHNAIGQKGLRSLPDPPQ